MYIVQKFGLRFFLMLLLGVCLPCLSLGSPIDKFDPREANETLNRLSLQLSVVDVESENLTQATSVILELRDKAQACVKESHSALDKTNADLSKLQSVQKNLDPNKQESDLIVKEIALLVEKKQNLSLRLSECQVFAGRAIEAIGVFSEATKTLLTSEIFKQEETLWDDLAVMLKEPFSVFTLDVSLLKEKYLSFNKTSFLGWGALLGVFLGLACYLLLVELLLSESRRSVNFMQLPKDIAIRLKPRLKCFGLLAMIGVIGFFLLTELNSISPYVRTGVTFYIVLVSINLMSVFWLVNRISFASQYNLIKLAINVFLHGFFVFIIATNLLGFNNLTYFVLKGLSFTLGGFLFAWFLHELFVRSLKNMKTSHIGKNILRKYLGVGPKDSLPEVHWLASFLSIMIWGGFIVLLMQVWGVSKTELNALKQIFFEGFVWLGVPIHPFRILIALFFLSLFVPLVRWIRQHIRVDKRSLADPSAKEAYATMIGYVGFTLTLLVVLMIAGVNFTSLTVIAGALSVGLGFGLQKIFHNIVSGIILLIERPIKPGDRIIMGDKEGFVKKVSVRSTHVKTIDYSDIIVPNSEILSNQLTNFMFQDPKFLVIIKVGVAYGSDISLVKQCLRKVASENNEVLNDKDHPIEIFFQNFGESALDFELWCIINHVNRKFHVATALNSAIDKIFKENNITIAFPQHDIHIKDAGINSDPLLARIDKKN